jgi:hypothetical protein
MKHVVQAHPVGCGLAVAAMLSGRSYRAARRAADGWSSSGGLGVRALCRLLKTLTGARWRVAAPFPRLSVRLAACRRLPAGSAVAVLIESPDRSRAHWVVVRRACVVHDPELRTPRPIAGYGGRGWLVASIIRRLG